MILDVCIRKQVAGGNCCLNPNLVLKAEGKSAREFSNAQMKIKPERRSRRENAHESTEGRCTRFVVPAAAGVCNGAVI